MNGRFAVVPAAYVLLLRPAPMPGGREVLLQLRRGTGFMDGHWAAGVAGHIEKGESAYDAARREAAEEVGVSDVVLEPLCAMQRTGLRDDPLDERVDYFFTATSWSGVPQLRERHRTAQLRWIDLATLPDPVVPHELRVLHCLRTGSTPPFLVHGFQGS